MGQVIQSNAELERMSHDNATEKMSFLSPFGPTIKEAKEAVALEKELVEDERRLEEEGVAVDFTKCKIREVQEMCPLPERLDPFTEALLGGVDSMAYHQALSLSYPILGFLGSNTRVLYASGKLRWMSGQTWQMGGSGTGKSEVLRALEELFLSVEREVAIANAMKMAEYSLLSEKERKETAMPSQEVRILDSIPTAIALLLQMQINGGGAIYLSCTECGEFGKKINAPYYSVILDMFKKSFDGTGESFTHKPSDKVYFVRSMKLCFNIGGTIDPMYKIFRQCDSDGTLSRGCVTMIGESKNEDIDGPYKSPEWTKEQRMLLMAGADRLRHFNNTYKEELKNETDDDPLNGQDDPYSDEVYDRAHDCEGNIPTRAEYLHSIEEQRVKLALSVPAIVAFGRETKKELARIGEIASDCCSRANEIAQAMAYLLYIANGLAEVPENEREAQYYDTLGRIIDVARWWVHRSIEAALAVQTNLNLNSKSQRENIRSAYKQQVGESATRLIYNEREEFFKQYEREHAGEIVTTRQLRDSSEVLSRVVMRTVERDLEDRRWPKVARGKWLVPKHEENDNRLPITDNRYKS